jgi:hypothetical protein
MLSHADDALVLSKTAQQVPWNELGRCFTLKEELIGLPKTCLGKSVQRVQLNNGVECWAFSFSQCIQAAVKNVAEHLSKRNDVNWNLPTKAETPLRTLCRLELHVFPELH